MMNNLYYLRETEDEGLGLDLEEPFDERFWLKVFTFAKTCKNGKLHFLPSILWSFISHFRSS